MKTTQISKTQIFGYVISTCELPGGGFETMAIKDEDFANPTYSDRYDTLEAALKGHTAIVDKVYAELYDGEVVEEYDESMDGDHDSAMASIGWGTDEDYGYYGE